MIQEHFGKFEKDIRTVSEQIVKTWCCVNQGPSKLEVKFDKNTYEPHEICKCQSIIDNSRCEVALQDIRSAIEQEITIDCKGYKFRDVITLTDHHNHGAQAREAQPVVRNFEVDLGSIKFNPPEKRKKKGKAKAISREDHFMMSQIPPACHGSIVTNEYFLAVRPTF